MNTNVCCVTCVSQFLYRQRKYSFDLQFSLYLPPPSFISQALPGTASRPRVMLWGRNPVLTSTVRKCLDGLSTSLNSDLLNPITAAMGEKDKREYILLGDRMYMKLIPGVYWGLGFACAINKATSSSLCIMIRMFIHGAMIYLSLRTLLKWGHLSKMDLFSPKNSFLLYVHLTLEIRKPCLFLLSHSCLD